jgi:hypothetical protein
MIAVYLLESLIIAFLSNLILRTSLKSHLVSSMIVGLAGFLLTEAFIIFVPGQITAFNGEPGNGKTWLLYNQGFVNGIAVFVFVVLWQIFIRNRRKD